MQDLSRSIGSPASLVSPSANIRFVGTQRTVMAQAFRLSRIMVISMLVRLSSTAVGLEGLFK